MTHTKSSQLPGPSSSTGAVLRAVTLFGSLVALFSSGLLAGCQESGPTSLTLQWGDVADRPWPGPHIWANRIQDWEVQDGKLIATSPLPMRTAHILSRRSTPEKGALEASLVLGLSGGAGGLLIGAGGPDLDHQKAALIHHSPGPGGGLFMGVDGDGFLAVRDFGEENQVLARSEHPLLSTDSLEFHAEVRETAGGEAGEPPPGSFQVSLTARSRDGSGSPFLWSWVGWHWTR